MSPASLLDSPALSAIFQALPGAYVLLSPELVIEEVSDSYLAATLTRREDLLGRSLFTIFPNNPAAHEAYAVRNLRDSLAQVLATGQPHEMPLQPYDVPDPERPGQFVERYWLPRHTPVRDAQGRVRHLLHTVVNVTEQHCTLTFPAKNLRAVVCNLFSNALKYRHPDRVPQVHLSYQPQEGY